MLIEKNKQSLVNPLVQPEAAAEADPDTTTGLRGGRSGGIIAWGVLEEYVGRAIPQEKKDLIIAVFQDEWVSEWNLVTEEIIDKFKTGPGGVPEPLIKLIRKFCDLQRSQPSI